MDAIIIDDEILARDRLVKLCQEIKDINIVEVCQDGLTAINEINQNNPDVIFLDIRMKDINGFEVLQGIENSNKPIVVLVTAYDEYAIKAFEFGAFDFLLKPYKDERFFKTIENIKKLSQPEINTSFTAKLNKLIELSLLEKKTFRIPIKRKGKTTLLNTEEINYICASGYYSEIYTDSKKYVIRDKLSNLFENLDPQKFHRIHRSTIINIDFIEEILHSDYSELDVRMKDNKKFRISKSHKKDFLKKIGLS